MYERARPLVGSARDYDPLMDRVGDARVVLLGEASLRGARRAREVARLARDWFERHLTPAGAQTPAASGAP